MLKEPVPQPTKRGGHAIAEIPPGPLAGLVCLGPPSLDDAVLRLAVGGPEPARVGGEPERREVGIELLGENEVEVGFDVGGARKARIIAEDPELRSVRDHAPERVGLGIQVLLHQAVRGQPATVTAEARIRLIEDELVGHEK